ncbi:MAG: L-serine ammonia-lyase, iron-sulfur-dependent, subunit alpha [Lachnospiraceae bacterium]|nr:L-serine ammonia-lyase, iron-sulfur-dependent, subunit alpha [Lachnospiraceae bacterium]
MSYHSMQEILTACEEQNKNFYEVIIEDDRKERGVSKEESYEKMRNLWEAMLSASMNYDSSLKSASGLVGGDGGKMKEYQEKGEGYGDTFLLEVVVRALQMGESNACMKRIVAAPTAGSCGVLPAVLVPLYQEKKVTEEKIIEALYVAAGIGQVIATRAFIAGAAGGCQAEIGSASSMAAGALVYLKGGSPNQIAQGAAIALKGLLGLACDPVAGLVEVPCVKRNVLGAVNALTSADMALAGIESAIPVDQVIDAMREIGEKMDVSLKETGEGGLAATERGEEMKRMLSKEKCN